MSLIKKDLLRFTTCGSVDDGKSTLIGRLLLDTKSVFQDQLNAIKISSKKRGDDYLDLSLFTDGLKSERQQGITIDVAYRYFSTNKRNFILADNPGHVQYTRNMVSGSSNSKLSIILIDARKGILQQTKRHTFLSSLLKIPNCLVCVNKMDLVDFNEIIFENIVKEFNCLIPKLDFIKIHFIPISALKGDNVVHKSKRMNWYKGNSLLSYLETINISNGNNLNEIRFPIQYVIRPKSSKFPDYRGYSGRIDGGVLAEGDEVKLLPTGYKTRIKKIQLNGNEIKIAYSPMSISVTLDDEIDICRGDMLIGTNNQPNIGHVLNIIICWMDEIPLKKNKKLIVKHTTNECLAIVKNLFYKIDINSFERIEEIDKVELNEIAEISITTSKKLFYDSYINNRSTGSIILIDEQSNKTIAGGMIQ